MPNILPFITWFELGNISFCITSECVAVDVMVNNVVFIFKQPLGPLKLFFEARQLQKQGIETITILSTEQGSVCIRSEDVLKILCHAFIWPLSLYSSLIEPGMQ